MDYEPCCSTGASGKGHPDTLSWDSSPKTGHWGTGSNWQEDMSVEVAVPSWGQSGRVMASDQQPLGSFWQGWRRSGQPEADASHAVPSDLHPWVLQLAGPKAKP